MRAGLVDLDLFDLKRFAHFAQHGSFHFGVSPFGGLIARPTF